MPTSRLQLRRLIGRDTAGSLFVTGSVLASPAPSTTQFALAELIDSTDDTTRFVGRYAYDVTQAESRVIRTWTKATGLAVVNRAYSLAPVATTSIMEIHRYDPETIHKAINDGLNKCVAIQLISIAPTAGMNYADLSAIPTIRNEKDIVSVYIAPAVVTGQSAAPRESGWFRFFEDGKLYFDAPQYLSTDDRIWVRAYAGYSALTSDASSTTCPDRWARSAAKVELYKLLMDEAGSGKDIAAYSEKLRRALADFRHYSRVYGRNEGKKIQFGTPVPWNMGYRNG